MMALLSASVFELAVWRLDNEINTKAQALAEFELLCEELDDATVARIRRDPNPAQGDPMQVELAKAALRLWCWLSCGEPYVGPPGVLAMRV